MNKQSFERALHKWSPAYFDKKRPENVFQFNTSPITYWNEKRCEESFKAA